MRAETTMLAQLFVNETRHYNNNSARRTNWHLTISKRDRSRLLEYTWTEVLPSFIALPGKWDKRTRMAHTVTASRLSVPNECLRQKRQNTKFYTISSK